MENSVQNEVSVVEIWDTSSFDIMLKAENGKTYYINRGTKQGLVVAELEQKILNKTVTLHLANSEIGTPTNHIAQLTLNDSVIFTEFD